MSARSLNRRLVPVSRVAAAMGVSSRTIKRRIAANVIRAVPLGCGRYAVPYEELERILTFGLGRGADN